MTTKRVDLNAFVGKSFDMVAHCEHSGEFITGNHWYVYEIDTSKPSVDVISETSS